MGAGQRTDWHLYPDELLKIPGSNGVRFIKRGDVPKFLDDEFHRSAWNQWCRWKRFGLPHDSGWIRERYIWIRCMEIIDEEQGIYQQSRLKEARS